MSKGQNSKKGSKKEPAKTMKEKKAAKREKKAQKANHGIDRKLKTQPHIAKKFPTAMIRVTD